MWQYDHATNNGGGRQATEMFPDRSASKDARVLGHMKAYHENNVDTFRGYSVMKGQEVVPRKG